MTEAGTHTPEPTLPCRCPTVAVALAFGALVLGLFGCGRAAWRLPSERLHPLKVQPVSEMTPDTRRSSARIASRPGDTATGRGTVRQVRWNARPGGRPATRRGDGGRIEPSPCCGRQARPATTALRPASGAMHIRSVRQVRRGVRQLAAFSPTKLANGNQRQPTTQDTKSRSGVLKPEFKPEPDRSRESDSGMVPADGSGVGRVGSETTEMFEQSRLPCGSGPCPPLHRAILRPVRTALASIGCFLRGPACWGGEAYNEAVIEVPWPKFHPVPVRPVFEPRAAAAVPAVPVPLERVPAPSPVADPAPAAASAKTP